ncbi:MAG: hypothetical protein HGA80_05285 [Candidatus Omnitrophica bacterium]|nr:hypothetical protein [Candidatus Omnitrophota bacterium]
MSDDKDNKDKKPGFFARLLDKLDKKMAEKANSSSCCCCSDSRDKAKDKKC